MEKKKEQLKFLFGCFCFLETQIAIKKKHLCLTLTLRGYSYLSYTRVSMSVIQF